MKKVKKIFIFLIFFLIVEGVKALPLKSTIFNSQNKPVGLIKIYIVKYLKIHMIEAMIKNIHNMKWKILQLRYIVIN